MTESLFPKRALEKQLQAKQQESGSCMPAFMYDRMDDYYTETASAIVLSAKKTGEQAPGFILKDGHDHPYSLKGLWRKGPVVMTFLHGAWCPYCMLQIAAYESILPSIRMLGATLVAVTMQKPDLLSHALKSAPPSFPILNDSSGAVALQFGVRMVLPGPIQRVCRHAGLDISFQNANGQWELPMAATYVIDGSGLIRYVYMPNTINGRMEPDDILSILQVLADSATGSS